MLSPWSLMGQGSGPALALLPSKASELAHLLASCLCHPIDSAPIYSCSGLFSFCSGSFGEQSSDVISWEKPVSDMSPFQEQYCFWGFLERYDITFTSKVKSHHCQWLLPMSSPPCLLLVARPCLAFLFDLHLSRLLLPKRLLLSKQTPEEVNTGSLCPLLPLRCT